MPSLTTSRFVLQSFLDELEEFDRDIPVARNIQVGDIADALLALLNNRHIARLTMPNVSMSYRQLPLRRVGRATTLKRRSRLSRSA